MCVCFDVTQQHTYVDVAYFGEAGFDFLLFMPMAHYYHTLGMLRKTSGPAGVSPHILSEFTGTAVYLCGTAHSNWVQSSCAGNADKCSGMALTAPASIVSHMDALHGRHFTALMGSGCAHFNVQWHCRFGPILPLFSQSYRSSHSSAILQGAFLQPPSPHGGERLEFSGLLNT